MNKDAVSLAHTSWNCKYHIVFAPKYRRKAFYGEKRREIGAILRQLCEWKNVEIVEAEVCHDQRYPRQSVGASLVQFSRDRHNHNNKIERPICSEYCKPSL